MAKKRLTEADKMVYLERLSDYLEKSSYMEQAIPLLIEINSLYLKLAHKIGSLSDEMAEKTLSTANSFHSKTLSLMKKRRDFDDVEVEYLEEWVNDMKFMKEKLSKMIEEIEELRRTPKLIN